MAAMLFKLNKFRILYLKTKTFQLHSEIEPWPFQHPHPGGFKQYSSAFFQLNYEGL